VVGKYSAGGDIVFPIVEPGKEFFQGKRFMKDLAAKRFGSIKILFGPGPGNDSFIFNGYFAPAIFLQF
jgi:hypothetical protein